MIFFSCWFFLMYWLALSCRCDRPGCLPFFPLSTLKKLLHLTNDQKKNHLKRVNWVKSNWKICCHRWAVTWRLSSFRLICGLSLKSSADLSWIWELSNGYFLFVFWAPFPPYLLGRKDKKAEWLKRLWATGICPMAAMGYHHQVKDYLFEHTFCKKKKLQKYLNLSVFHTQRKKFWLYKH